MAERDYKQEITDRMVAALEQGTAPWTRPHAGYRDAGRGPYNYATGREYRGINRLTLGMSFADSRWMTFKQAKDQGYAVRPGEKGMPIEVWRTYERKAKDRAGNLILEEDGTPKTETGRFAKFYTVFNGSQIEGMPTREPVKVNEVAVDEVGEKLLEPGVGKPEIRFDQPDTPHYRPALDTVHMPDRETFNNDERFYGTLAHEIAHSTGHATRLGRFDGKAAMGFGSPEYAREELRAEIASWMLADRTGIPHDPSLHEAYVASWIKSLQNDKNEIFRAAADAEKITQDIVERYHLPELEVDRGLVKDKEIAMERTADRSPEREVQGREVQGKLVVADERGAVLRTPEGRLETLPGRLQRLETAKGYQQAGIEVRAKLDGGQIHITRSREQTQQRGLGR